MLTLRGDNKFQIFSNGDVDPWGPGGVMKEIRNDLPAPIVKGGAHHYDIRGSHDGDTGKLIYCI